MTQSVMQGTALREIGKARAFSVLENALASSPQIMGVEISGYTPSSSRG